MRQTFKKLKPRAKSLLNWDPPNVMLCCRLNYGEHVHNTPSVMAKSLGFTMYIGLPLRVLPLLMVMRTKLS